ncbi:hypothetical protein DMC47_16130 [Nostoc sp. 3335mG]|nr:hypothetical protein DMC47_16130 [Nostoc sp. 3335mG]
MLPGSETCCDGQPPRIATSRRLLLAGFAALPLAACPAPVPARPAGVCAKLAKLIERAADNIVALLATTDEPRTGLEQRRTAIITKRPALAPAIQSEGE